MVARKADDAADEVEILQIGDTFYATSRTEGHVLVSLGDSSYPNSCECRGFRFHYAGTNKLCRHLKALQQHLCCPRCLGSGEVERVTINIITNRTRREMATCSGCLGAGTRQAFEELAAAAPPVARPADPLDEWRAMSETEKRAVFA